MSETQEFRCFSRLKEGTQLERILCFITSACILTIAIMAITLAYFGNHRNNLGSKEMDPSNVCLTPTCIKAASSLLSSIDETIDPCDDFYQFVCGQWIKTHTIPEDEKSVYVYDEIEMMLKLRVKALLETKLDGTEPRFITMAKDLYDACMDVDSMEKVGAEPLQNILKSLGGWPVIEGSRWDENKFDWIESIASIRKLGYESLLKCYIWIDAKNTSRYILQLGETPLGMPYYYLKNGLNDTVTAAYFKKMAKAATLLGADREIAEEELLEVLNFEIALSNHIDSKKGSPDDYNKYSIKQLQEIAPQVLWLKYFNGFLTHTVYENENVNVIYPELIKSLSDLIAITDKRVIANYIGWMVVHSSAKFLTKEWREIDFDYLKALTGVLREKPRWNQCLQKHLLWVALSSLYVRQYDLRETKEKATEIVNYVYKEFLRILEDTEWMDEKTKQHAREKANNMLFVIAYPDELLNDTAIMEYYQTLTITKGSYFENCLRARKWKNDNEFSKLRTPNDRKDWKKSSVILVVNAYYDIEDNTIKYPMGYLNSPLFDKEQPNYLNFGITGFTAGHEITHGFDSLGRMYDKDGNKNNWWDKRTDEKYKKKAQCIIDLYSNYTVTNGMKVNGKRTLGENIADIGGLKESYLAYQTWVNDNGPEKLLPGLKYNQNQLFWIHSAYSYCSIDRPEFLTDLIITDPHSPDEFRVLGPRSNLPEFARDFNCPLGSPMNRIDKCQIW